MSQNKRKSPDKGYRLPVSANRGQITRTSGDHLMLSAKTIRSYLNGGGSAAGVKGLKQAIDTIEAELLAHRAELDAIPAKRADAALADDAQKAVAALSDRENYLYGEVEIGEVRLGRLRARLAEVTIDERKADFTERRAAIVKASDEVAAAVRKAHEATIALVGLRESATAAGFASEVHGIPLPPLIVNLVDATPLLDPFETAMAHYRKTAATLAPAQVPSASRGPSFSHTDAKLRLAPAGVIATAKAVHKPAAPAPSRPKLRDLFNEQPREGERRVKILRSGYETPDGRQCRTGDIVALPMKIAQSAVQHGSGEFDGAAR
jgi:hypothetical protein